MKTLKILALTVLFTIGAVSNVYAQRGGGQAQQSSVQGHQMALLYSDELGLSDEQKQEIASIFADFRFEQRAVRSETRRRGERGAARQRQQERQKSVMADARAVLTPEQQTKLDEMSTRLSEQRMEWRGNLLDAHVRSVADQIGLDDSKTEQVRTIMANHRESATPMQGRANIREMSMEERRDRLDRRIELQQNLRSVMTEEEFEDWQETWSELMPGWNMQRGQGRMDMQRRQQDRPGRQNRNNR